MSGLDEIPGTMWKRGAELQVGDKPCEADGAFFEVEGIERPCGAYLVYRLGNPNGYRTAPPTLQVKPFALVRVVDPQAQAL